MNKSFMSYMKEQGLVCVLALEYLIVLGAFLSFKISLCSDVPLCSSLYFVVFLNFQ